MLVLLKGDTQRQFCFIYYVEYTFFDHVSIELFAKKSIDKGEMNILILVLYSGFTGTLFSAYDVV